MWNPAAKAPISPEYLRDQIHNNKKINNNNKLHSPKYINYSNLNDFNHIMESSNINFTNIGPNNMQSSLFSTNTSEQPSIGVDSMIQGLLAPEMGCSRCTQISNIRESLKGVESSYLDEIEHLRNMITQIDRERVDAVERVEKTLLAFDRCRQQNLSKDREIQSIRSQLRQCDDKLQRLEYELNSLYQLYKRDINFYNEREIYFFLENECYSREAILSSESGWRSALETIYINIIGVNRRDSISHLNRYEENLTSSSCVSEIQLSKYFGLSPSPNKYRSPPSITRNPEEFHNNCSEKNINSNNSCNVNDSSRGVMITNVKNGLLTELRQSKKSADELNEKLQSELKFKCERISLLEEQLSLKEEKLFKLSQERLNEEKLTCDMQEEIDDMLRSEIWLSQKCERHCLETEEIETRLEILRWFQQQQQQKKKKKEQQQLYINSLQKKRFDLLDKTPEKQRISSRYYDPLTTKHTIFDQQNSGNSEELCTFISNTISETLEKLIKIHMMPLKLSVESIRASSGEMNNNLDKIIEMIPNFNYCHKEEKDMSSQIVNEIKDTHNTFINDVRNILKEFTIITNNNNNNTTKVKLQTSNEITVLREVIKKMARLTSHNSKIMDDKLNDILTCQSSVARQLALAAVPPINKSSISFTKEYMDLPKYNEDNNKLLELVEEKEEEKTFDKKCSFTLLPSHEWDVAESDDESIPPIPEATTNLTKRKTPYDIDDNM